MTVDNILSVMILAILALAITVLIIKYREKTAIFVLSIIFGVFQSLRIIAGLLEEKLLNVFDPYKFLIAREIIKGIPILLFIVIIFLANKKPKTHKNN